MRYDPRTVKNSIDIVDVVREHVQLRHVGSTGRYLGLCVFHQEKTPSFNVSQTRQTYRCFGCGVAGDAIDFLMRIEGASFPEAVNRLAQRCGIAPSHTPASRVSVQEVIELAEVLRDFQYGLQIAVQGPLGSVSDFLLSLGIDSAECLGHLHMSAHIANTATPDDIGQTWDQMRRKNPDAVDRIVRLGREDRENAQQITSAIIDLIACSQERAL